MTTATIESNASTTAETLNPTVSKIYVVNREEMTEEDRNKATSILQKMLDSKRHVSYTAIKTVIMPEEAKFILENCNNNNRPLKENKARYFANLMTAGMFGANSGSITFDQYGNLADGQHRIFASYLSGVPLECTILRDFPASAKVNIDQGTLRSTNDAMHIMGHNNVTSNMCQVLNAFVNLPNVGKPSPMEVDKLLGNKRIVEACEFALNLKGKGKANLSASILGVFARAFYNGKDVEKIKRFAHIVTVHADNIVDEAASYDSCEREVLRFRNWYNAFDCKGGNARSTLVPRCSFALQKFLLQEQNVPRTSYNSDSVFVDVMGCDPFAVAECTEIVKRYQAMRKSK